MLSVYALTNLIKTLGQVVLSGAGAHEKVTSSWTRTVGLSLSCVVCYGRWLYIDGRGSECGYER